MAGARGRLVELASQAGPPPAPMLAPCLAPSVRFPRSTCLPLPSRRW
jgi:hypothetical protein